MNSVFDLEQLAGLLRDFYEISLIRITVFDENLTELISYPARVAPYCTVIRGTMKGLEACMRCDRRACAAAAQKRRTHVYRCHAGLTEAVTPLYVGDVLAGYLLFGHVFTYDSHDEGWETISRLTEGLHVNERMLKEAIENAVPISEHYVRSAAHILHAVASYLIMERMATLQEDLLTVRLDAYISAHFTEKLNAATLAQALGIGKTQLYELSHKLYSQGTAARVRELRMEKTKDLLTREKHLPLAEVAAQCGYQDYNYFFTVFSREVGCTPTTWRNQKH
ncbi:MAG: PocR ligand-binding domain-containing protein [Firmicutes bacterium]|nr:PocR ligand-binding domain-containing protein [Bacillota bacterium]